MKKRSKKTAGVTLVELIVYIAIIGTLSVALLQTVRTGFDGAQMVQKSLPVQRDLQMLAQVVQRDVLSSSRGSLGNLVDGGFEKSPLSRDVTRLPGQWVDSTVPMDLADRWNNGFAIITSSTSLSRSGRHCLMIWHAGRSYSVQMSSPMSAGNYQIGGWIRSNGVDEARIQLLDASSNVVASTGSFGLSWTYVTASYLISSPGVHTIRLLSPMKSSPGSPSYLTVYFDDIVLSQEVVALIPGSPDTFQFDRFSLAGKREHVQYRVVPDGTSGRLFRQRFNYLISAWEPDPGGTFGSVAMFSASRSAAAIWRPWQERALFVRLDMRHSSWRANSKDPSLNFETEILAPTP